MTARRLHLSENPLLHAREALAVSLRRIETLAALLEELTARNPREPVEGSLVGQAAGMIADEAMRMRALLQPHWDGQTRKACE